MRLFEYSLADILPMTAIQTQRLSAMNDHWSNADGVSNLVSLAIVVVSLGLFFLVMRAILSAVQKKSKRHTQTLRAKNKDID